MNEKTKEMITAPIRDFHFPKYDEIPNVGLYLEQITKYINEYLAPFEDLTITASMISNYVKKGLIANPVKKQYYREQIAYLFFIAAAKSVLSLDNIALFLEMQKSTYTAKKAYDYFCLEFENVLSHVFGLKENLDTVGEDNSHEKTMLRNTIITIAHKIYLDKCFYVLRMESESASDNQHTK
jgi:DNA-binding transcriptional MerR regulator